MILELRAKNDPYMVFAEAHYNMGRDMGIILWLSILTLAIAIVLTFIVCIMIFIVARKAKREEIEHRTLQ